MIEIIEEHTAWKGLRNGYGISFLAFETQFTLGRDTQTNEIGEQLYAQMMGWA